MPWAVATIALFCSVAASKLVTARLVQQRSNALHTYYRTGSIADLADAFRLVDEIHVITWVTVAVVLAGVITLATWTCLVTINARDRGVPGVHPMQNAGLWFIPLFGGAYVMRRLGRLVNAFDYSDHRLTQWRYLFYANFFLFILMDFAVGTGFSQQRDIESSGRALDREVIVTYVTAIIFVISAYVAGRAIVHADRAISERRH